MADDFDVDAMLEAAYQNKSIPRLAWPSYETATDLRNFIHECLILQNYCISSTTGMVLQLIQQLIKLSSRSVFKGGEGSGSGSRSRDRDRGDNGDGRSPGASNGKYYGDEKEEKGRDRDRDRKKSKKSRSRSRDRKRRSDRDRKRSRSRSPRDRRRRSRSRSPRDGKRRGSRSRSKERRSGGGRGRGGDSPPPKGRLGGPPKRRSRSRSPLRLREEEPLSPEDRDARTVFCMQLSQRVRARDLEDFFSSVGKVRDVRMITCNKTRRFKGIAYVEFKEISSVGLALGLGGQKLLGIPIIVQPSQAEKNRAGQMAKAGALAAAMASSAPGPMKLYVGSLHFNITEDMLKGIFEPFGRIEEILLMKDHETGRSKGFGFITFMEGEDAKRALEQLNGFEIAGRPMKVGYVTDKAETAYYANPQTFLDSDEMDRAGVNLGVTGRLQLMAKLAEGTDLKLPEAATSALQMQNQLQQTMLAPSIPATPPIATQCFMLANMFDPLAEESNPQFESEIRDDVLEACLEHGGAVHIYVDVHSPEGNCYIKCPTVAAAVAAVNTFHGRWFAGRLITAAYVPLFNYHNLFPDSMAAQVILRPSAK